MSRLHASYLLVRACFPFRLTKIIFNSILKSTHLIDYCWQIMDEDNMTKSEEQHLSLQKALQQCELVQNMIDISISSLEGLRTKCATSNDLTQKEIRTLEVSISFHHS